MNKNKAFFHSTLHPHSLRLGPSFAVLGSFLLVTIVSFCGSSPTAKAAAELREFEIGRVAERDVIAERSVSYVDENATRLRKEAQERLVPAVFRYSQDSSRDSLIAYERFASLARRLFTEKASIAAYRLAIQAEFPGTFSKESIDALFRNPSRLRFLESGGNILKVVLDGGIVALPRGGLDTYNPDSFELVRKSGGRSERERIPYSKAVTLTSVSDRISEVASDGSYPEALSSISSALLAPFVMENVFFSAEDSSHRLEEARSRVEPVLKPIERGDRIIRKGFIVSKDDIERLRALGGSFKLGEGGRALGRIILLALSFGLFIFLAGPRVVGRLLDPAEVYLLAALSAAYLVGAVLAGRTSPPVESFPLSIYLPTALIIMLPAVLMGPRLAAAIAVSLPIAAFVSGSFDASAFAFALSSGIAGSYFLQGAERRMDLLKAGSLIAIIQVLSATAVLLIERASVLSYPSVLFWAAFNALASALMVLGLLPLLEQLLNAATPFRLIELSDLNLPILKRLLTVAPGTYSHSVTVANLAESACREIGANSLLARVGAYYHDIGKMDQPDYFIENQAAYNKHEELAPRLSATVIRSHVKVGVEKARRLGLPKAVIDIIAEHHGNSVINWFYNEALKREDQVNVEDFAYPGNPPRSRESAVVMLADTVEAAVRTLKKPTMSRLEKFTQELIMAKFEQGQLSESELTFRDLELIKNAFVRVLAGHYHSRIEYPKNLREAVR
ncbi:HDIG domain-containing protein [Treponema sp.]